LGEKVKEKVGEKSERKGWRKVKGFNYKSFESGGKLQENFIFLKN
jgi:hypothetical protein